MSVKIPVYQNATIVQDTLQPIVFSHGLKAHRNIYATLYMELASCGYFVIALSHNDQSADYTPKAGVYDLETEGYDYKVKNLQVKVRENEVLALCEEIQKEDFMANFGFQGRAKLSDDLVIMGHSFGGITVLGAA